MGTLVFLLVLAIGYLYYRGYQLQNKVQELEGKLGTLQNQVDAGAHAIDVSPRPTRVN